MIYLQMYVIGLLHETQVIAVPHILAVYIQAFFCYIIRGYLLSIFMLLDDLKFKKLLP